MKKLFSTALALVLTLSMGTAAFADESSDPYNGKLDLKPTITKTYEVKNGTAPAETFTYKFEAQSWTDQNGAEGDVNTMPAIADVSITYDEAISKTTVKSVDVSINADAYDLGVYKYNVTEVAGSTAGVTYSTENLYLVLSIVRDENNGKHYVAALHYENEEGSKTDNDLTNVYDSGSLKVTKQIEGNMADMTKKFAFTITFDAGSKTWTNAIVSDSENGTWSADGLTYTISLGDDESVTLSNIPAGLTYTVSEDAENYTSDQGVFSDDSKSISANDQDTVTFTNTLTQGIDTGISLDSMPYILLLAVAFMGLFMFFTKKRMIREN